MVVPIFSHGAIGPTHVRLARGSGGIKKNSVLFCEELTTLDRDFLTHGPLGAPVASEILGAVLSAVRRALGDTLPEPASARSRPVRHSRRTSAGARSPGYLST